jgi:hypothetical protein
MKDPSRLAPKVRFISAQSIEGEIREIGEPQKAPS